MAEFFVRLQGTLFTSFEMLCRQNPPLFSKYVYSFTYICMLSAIVLSFAFQPKLYLSAVHVNENAANSRIHFPKAKKREFRAKPVKVDSIFFKSYTNFSNFSFLITLQITLMH